MKLIDVLLAASVLFASASQAGKVTIGNVYVPTGWGAMGTMASNGVYTNIDLEHPATASGLLYDVGFALGTFEDECPDLVKIKIFRRAGTVLTMVAERGPLTYRGDVAFPIFPPMGVEEGDLIGITMLEPVPRCGYIAANGNVGTHLYYPGDVTGSVTVEAGEKGTGALAVWGIGTTDQGRGVLTGVLPVVGSSHGAMGSRWTTSVRVVNPFSVSATGFFVFRPANDLASNSEANLPFDVAAGEGLTIADVSEALGVSGLGSLDVVSDEGSPSPLVFARVTNGGGGETSVLTVEAIDPRAVTYPLRVLHAGAAGVLKAPPPESQARFNIGIRTLGEGALVSVTVGGEGGRGFTRKLPPHYFVQMAAHEFLGFSPGAGEAIRFEVTKGAAIVYGATTDNVTNIPQVEYAAGYFLSPDR